MKITLINVLTLFDVFFRNVENFHVRAGSSQYFENGVVYTIDEIVVHPRFNEISRDFDVGLLKVHFLILAFYYFFFNLIGFNQL